MKIGLAGQYRLVAHKLDGSQRVLADWFENVITDSGLDKLGTGGVMSYCQVGSGSSAPNILNSGLDSQIAATQSVAPNGIVFGVVSTPPYNGYTRFTFRFPIGAAAGNLSEVGVGWGATGNIFSRALIVDAEGQPTVITILSDEILDVTYEIRFYPPLDDAAGTWTVGGVTYNTIMRASMVGEQYWAGRYLTSLGVDNQYYGSWICSPRSGGIGTIFARPSGVGGGPDQIGLIQPYSAGSRERQWNFIFGLDAGNVPGGIKSMGFDWGHILGLYQCEFDTPIPKDNTKVLNFGVKIGWGRRTI